MKPYGLEQIKTSDEVPDFLLEELGRLLLQSSKDIQWVKDLLPRLDTANKIGKFIIFFHEDEHMPANAERDFKNDQEIQEERMQRILDWKDQIGLLSDDEIKKYAEAFDLDLQRMKNYFGTSSDIAINNPDDILREFNKYVIGQEEAKQFMASSLYCHHLRINANDSILNGDTMPKYNILLTGPSGCGKTYLAKIASRILDVPFIKIDAASLVESGIIGNSLADYFQAAYNREKHNSGIEYAIVFIDEIDKISRGRSYYSSSVQAELLNIIGEQGEISFRKEKLAPTITISCDNMLFILAGAFEGLRREKRNETNIGFSKNGLSDPSDSLDRQDIIDHGFLPEIINRIQKVIQLHALDKDDFIDILKKAHSTDLERYDNYAKKHGKRIEFTDDFIEILAEQAMSSGMNGRSIKNILADVMCPVLFECTASDSDQIVLDASYLKKQFKAS